MHTLTFKIVAWSKDALEVNLYYFDSKAYRGLIYTGDSEALVPWMGYEVCIYNYRVVASDSLDTMTMQ